jgi:hypothetical protein
MIRCKDAGLVQRQFRVAADFAASPAPGAAWIHMAGGAGVDCGCWAPWIMRSRSSGSALTLLKSVALNMDDNGSTLDHEVAFGCQLIDAAQARGAQHGR